MRKIGIDYGDSRIGIAISDASAKLAGAYSVYQLRGRTKALAFLKQLALDQSADAFVLGAPLNMDGTAGERLRLVKEFGALLQSDSGLPVIYADERLSTVEAQQQLDEVGMPRVKQREVIDKVAAQIILQKYLDNPSVFTDSVI